MLSNRKRFSPGVRGGTILAVVVAALAWAPLAFPGWVPALTCVLKPGESALPAGTRHGLALHLRQYPDLALATPSQRRAAERLLASARAATLRWRDLEAADRMGFATHLARRTAGDVSIGYLHAENRRNSADRHDLDPRRPESLIYATQPGRKPVLIGVMFSVARGVRGPTPAGPIARWHSHLVCGNARKRGLSPPPNGCPAGTRLTQGSEMLHLWFTSDLRSAFAIHAPVPELCRDRVLTPAACRAGGGGREM